MLVKPTLKLRLSMQYLNGQQCIVFHEVLFIEEKIGKSRVYTKVKFYNGKEYF